MYLVELDSEICGKDLGLGTGYGCWTVDDFWASCKRLNLVEFISTCQQISTFSHRGTCHDSRFNAKRLFRDGCVGY